MRFRALQSRLPAARAGRVAAAAPARPRLLHAKAAAAAASAAAVAAGGPSAFVSSCQLADFGAARRARDARYYVISGDVGLVPWHGVAGTIGYIAPEILGREAYGVAVDAWSVGILLFELLAGFAPFFPYSSCVREPAPPLPDSASPEARDLVARLLDADPARRLSCAQARLHPWLLATR